MNRTLETKTIDGFLVLVAFAFMAAFHFAPDDKLAIPPEHRVYLVIMVPMLYVVASAVLARVNLSSGAGRAYFMYLCSSIVAICLLLSDVLKRVSNCLTMPSDEMMERLALLAQSLSPALLHVALPFGAAIALYAFCSVFESEAGVSLESSMPAIDGATGSKSLELIGGILSTLDLPVEIRQFMLESVQSLTSLNAQCIVFKQNVEGLDVLMRKLGEGSSDSYDQLTALTSAIKVFVCEFEGLSSVAKITHANSQLIAKSTLEMLKVLDEFALLANHEVLSK